MLARLRDIEHEPDDERWMLLDADHFSDGTHLKNFIGTLAEAAKQGIHVALSKPCFELWLLLHHEDESAAKSLSCAADVEAALRMKLGQYNKTNLRQQDYPVASVTVACMRAEMLDKTVTGGGIPSNNTTRVYMLWKAIVAKALPSQLPVALRSLLP